MLVTLDFESYYDADYTLKKLATSEYVRDPRFETLSCGIKLDDGPTTVYFGVAATARAFAEIDWARATLLAHHTHFDGLILSHHYGYVPERYADTLSMARALQPKGKRNDLATVASLYGKQNKLEMPDVKGKHLADLTPELKEEVRVYNSTDVDVCYEVYTEMVKGFPLAELDLIDITVRMFADPVLKVDLDGAKTELDREITAKEAAIAASGSTAKELSSNPKFVKTLEALGIDVPMKPSPSIANKTIPAVAKSDEALQALLSHPDDKVVALVTGRLAAKSTIGESRAARLISYGTAGNLPIYLSYCGAHTMRWSGGDKLNPQNFKQAQKTGGALRRCIVAPDGYEIVVVDAAQIEARVCAWLAEELELLEDFRLGRDPYCAFGSKAYGRPITKQDKEERFVGKTCVLGLGYGMGGAKLQTTVLNQSINQGLTPVRLPLDVCYTLVSVYRSMNVNIANLWRFLNDVGIRAMLEGSDLEFKCIKFIQDAVEMPNGLKLLYPGLDGHIAHKKAGHGFFTGMQDKITVADASYLTFMGRNKIYGGLFLENIVQCLARIIVGDVMRIVAQKYRVVMSTHDEIAALVKIAEVQEALDWIIKLLSIPPSWAPDLPLSAEGSHGVAYSK